MDIDGVHLIKFLKYLIDGCISLSHIWPTVFRDGGVLRVMSVVAILADRCVKNRIGVIKSNRKTNDSLTCQS